MDSNTRALLRCLDRLERIQRDRKTAEKKRLIWRIEQSTRWQAYQARKEAEQ